MIYDCRDPQQMASALALNNLFPPALRYWQVIKTDRLPSRLDIDPIDIPDLLPNIMLLDVLEGGKDFRYRLAGTAVERNFGAPIKGLTLGAIVQSFPSIEPVLDVKIHCAETASPYACDAAMFTHFGTRKQVYCFAMPLSDDGVIVTQIFAIGILERITEPAGLAR
ncbi:MAG TPA: PAS domain-containing protein [Dongiaceae bacterium]|nr:PAS domain-containing protein [Dongiaceae bacterium]